MAGSRVSPAVVCLLGLLGSACASAGLPIARQRPGAPSSARPGVAAVTLESSDPALSAALIKLALSPTAEAHRQVALEYRRLGVLDQAHAYFTKAVKLDPNDAAALDELARIWRDWGFPERGMADAQHAVQLAPASASAANTVGTLLEAAGHATEARDWYVRAVWLDPNASYALNNLCYSAIMLTHADATAQCRRALAAAPDSRVAWNNLGLAYAAAGDLVHAKELFDVQADRAYAHYNLGIVYMGTRQYAKALAAFTAAMQLDPQFGRAAERAKQARNHIETLKP
jgi:tetratricopeptide (TPR) repeat protein